jgi:hypothetical protein
VVACRPLAIEPCSTTDLLAARCIAASSHGGAARRTYEHSNALTICQFLIVLIRLPPMPAAADQRAELKVGGSGRPWLPPLKVAIPARASGRHLQRVPGKLSAPA